MGEEEHDVEWYEQQIAMLNGAIEGWRKEIARLRAELVRVNEQRNALRVRLQCLAGDLERATLSAIRTVSRKWEVSDE